jgi:cytochrome c
MDGFELNKIAGAVLTAMLVIAGGRTLLDIAVPDHRSDKMGWNIPVKETTPGAGTKAPPPFEAGAVLAMLPKANPDNGADIFRKCQACHTPQKGGANLVGPNLWGIVGRQVAQAQGFEARYSPAMKGHGGEWTWQRLAEYLHKPAEAIPGNKMQFEGVQDDADLADLLAFLGKLSDSPPPPPKADSPPPPKSDSPAPPK